MKKTVSKMSSKWFLAPFAFAILLGLGILFLMSRPSYGHIDYVVSPSGERGVSLDYKVYGGPGASMETLVSLATKAENIKGTHSLPVIAIMDGDVNGIKIRWIDNQSIEILYPSKTGQYGTEFLQKNAVVNDINITYKSL